MPLPIILATKKRTKADNSKIQLVTYAFIVFNSSHVNIAALLKNSHWRCIVF